ncbi:MAG: ribokinase [Dermatophilaceae bacterium]|nr:ribokinase [Dermatophilaceae bacterium]
MSPASGVVVVGSLNADLTITTDRLPSAGETVAGHDFVTRPGGKGANQAVAASRLGCAVSLIGVVGDDAHGTMLVQAAHRDGVDTDSIVRIADTPTGVAVIEVDAQGENSIVVFPGANGRLEPHHIEREAERIAAAAVVCLCLESPLETIMTAARLGHQAGATVLLNLSPFRKVPAQMLADADLLLVNEHEAAQLLGSTDPTIDWDATALEFAARGMRDVVVTLGARGSMVIQGGPENFPVLTPIPAVPTHVVDTTGCGDAFTGAIADSLARGDGLVTAARRAALVASMAAATEGAQDSYPTLNEVRAHF